MKTILSVLFSLLFIIQVQAQTMGLVKGGFTCALSASDNFNRSDSNALGASWVEVENAATDMTIWGNALLQSEVFTSHGFAYWNTAWCADQYSEAAPTFAGPDKYTGPAVRIDTSGTATNATFYIAVLDNVNENIRLRKYVGETLDGAGTQIGTWTGTVLTGEVIRIEASGNQITVKHEGTIVIGPITDSSIASGSGGIAIVNTSSPVTHGWDNWAGGDL